MPSYVVVGASRGLGYEWIRQLSQDPSNTVIGTVRSIEPVQAKLDSDNIKNVTLLQADLVDHKSLEAAADAASKITKGSLDYLIVNGAYLSEQTAGFNPTEFSGKEDLLKRDMIQSVEVNVIGNIYAINAFLPLIRQGSVKKVVSISSGMGDLDMVLKFEVPGSVTYAAVKAALNMVIAKYAIELKPEGIAFLALSPGVVNTRTEPPSEEDMVMIGKLFSTFQKAYPEWKGPIQAEESVNWQKKVIENLTLEQSGQFLSHLGSKQWL